MDSKLDPAELADILTLARAAKLEQARAAMAEAAMRLRVAELAVRYECGPEDIQADGTIRRAAQ